MLISMTVKMVTLVRTKEACHDLMRVDTQETVSNVHLIACERKHEEASFLHSDEHASLMIKWCREVC